MHWAYYVCYSLKCVLYKSGVPGYHKYHRCKDQPEIKFCLATLQTDYYKQKDYFLFIQDPKSLKSNAWKAMNSPQKKKKPQLFWMHIEGRLNSLLFPASKRRAYFQVSWRPGFHAYQNCPTAALTGKSELSRRRYFSCQGDWYLQKLQGATSCHGKLHNPWQLGSQLTRQSCRLGSKQLCQHCTALHNKGRLIEVWGRLHTCSSSCYQKDSLSIHKPRTVYPPESVRTIRSSRTQRELNGSLVHVAEWSSRCLKWVDGEHVGQFPTPGVSVTFELNICVRRSAREEATGRISM